MPKRKNGNTLRVNTIFVSQEGEGGNIGKPECFVRFQGCTANCLFCDTPEALNKFNGKAYNQTDILSEIYNRYPTHNSPYNTIVLTGGEPMEQSKNVLRRFIQKLHVRGYNIIMETNGLRYDKSVFKLLKKDDMISSDIKPPSANVKFSFETIRQIDKIRNCKVQFKIVVQDWTDFEFVLDILTKNLKHEVIITPCWKVSQGEPDIDFIKEMLDRIRREDIRIRVILQQHKIIFGHRRGV